MWPIDTLLAETCIGCCTSIWVRAGGKPTLRGKEASPATDAVGAHGLSVSALSGSQFSPAPPSRALAFSSWRAGAATSTGRPHGLVWLDGHHSTADRFSLRRGYDEG